MRTEQFRTEMIPAAPAEGCGPTTGPAACAGQDLDELMRRVTIAQERYSTFTQAQVNRIFREAALAANEARIALAKMAVEETGMGVVEDKVIKNHFAAEYVYTKYKDTLTCGVLEEDPTYGIKKIAEPIGVIAGIVPTTNPTSTAIFKALLALKTRNAIVFSPHPRAKACTVRAARVVLDAAVKAGAPPDIIAWIEEPTVELSQALMRHPAVGLILATGGPGMVKAAYSSGKPAIGVGSGNTPAVIDETADIPTAVSSILLSKTFDNGMVCASEQSLIVVEERYDAVKRELAARGAHFLTAEEKLALEGVMMRDGKISPDVVGQSAERIARMAGFAVPPDTKILVGEAERVGAEEPFAFEKLSPLLAMYRAPDFDAASSLAEALVEFGGIGHTAVLYTDQRANEDRVRAFGLRTKTGRVLVNMPASQGAIGDIYNFRLEPSLTLGCGSWGGNSVSENVGVKHLLNVKTVAERRENMLWFRVPPKIYFKPGSLPTALGELAGRARALIVTDKPLYDLGYTALVTKVLDGMKIRSEVFFDVEPDPKLSTVERGLKLINAFQPDVIIALGGGSPIDAAKIMWMLYEHPEVSFEGLAMRFMDIRKRIYAFPEMGKKAILVAIPTTSGTGSEVTPFAVVTDDQTGIKYPIADYALTPSMAIVDPDLVASMPKRVAAYSGIDAVTHAIEAYVSVFATDYTDGLALQALRLLFRYLPDSYRGGKGNQEAREKVHYAATVAGMAFGNSFLGVCHSMAHKLGSTFHLAHGLAIALLLTEVIRYNAVDAPSKQVAFPQYRYPHAKERYAEIAEALGLAGDSVDAKVAALILAIERLKADLEIPGSIREIGISEEDFRAALDSMSEQAFDDQCTGGNPRYPLIEEIKALYLAAYSGRA